MSLNAIYGEGTLASAPESQDLCILHIPAIQISLRLAIPAAYPDVPPEIIGPESVSSELRKGEAHKVVNAAREWLEDNFTVDEPCLYDLVEYLQNEVETVQAFTAPTDTAQDQEAPTKDTDNLSSINSTDTLISVSPPPWHLSPPTTEKRSIFIARAARVTSPHQATTYLQHLLHTDKKVAKATHNMTAWRMRDAANPAVTYQDCDDDGETAAGARLLHLLQLMDVCDVMVVVSRWYGGVLLGPDRFRIINSVAREALVGLLTEEGVTEGAGQGGGRKGTHR